ncbi:MFS transporter [Paenibacillus hamazuiensis]|uniref:MFS transporter n=1 Tax=Paenibacillus hamazuiensis TaxID=2936508 RepID=UPI00200F886B|nr:MFS transporter [Paenibacillus hamazuiensis]
MNTRFIVILLALGAFFAGTAELVIVGIVDLIASDFQISVGLAGQLVTVFSIAFAVGSPVVIALTARTDRKKLLLATLAFSVLGNVIALVGHSSALLMVSRIVLGITTGVFAVTAFTTAAGLSAPERQGSAIGNVHVGFSGSLVLGVPLGIFMARHWGWESIFGMLAIFNALIFVLMAKLLPRMPGRADATLRSQAGIVKQSKIIGALAISFLCVFGYSICYTYLAPYLQERAHMGLASISWMMLLMGVCGTAGTRFGGYATDKWGIGKTLIAVMTVHALILLLSPLLSSSPAGAILMIVVWGLSAWATVPAIQCYLISLAPGAANVAVSINTSVFQFGIALGAAAGGIVIERTGAAHLGWIGGIAVLLAILTAVRSFARERHDEVLSAASS